MPVPQSSTQPRPRVQPKGLGARVLRRVLAHYDVGELRSIEPILRGSSRSPKLLLTTERGRFVLKQHDCDDPFVVAFMHRVLLSLGRAGVPVPTLVGTREANNSIVQLEGRIFQLTHMIEGRACLATPEDATASGAMLRSVHDALDADPALNADAPNQSGEHDRLLNAFARTEARLDPQHAPELARARTIYNATVTTLASAPAARPALVHGDWHPGNLIVHAGDASCQKEINRIIGVLDLARCHRGSREDELAFACLQHGLTKGDDPGTSCEHWAPETALDRVEAFLTGYAEHDASRIDTIAASLSARMIQRLLAEAVTRLSIEGSVGRHPAPAVLRMIVTKADWLHNHDSDVAGMVDRVQSRCTPTGDRALDNPGSMQKMNLDLSPDEPDTEPDGTS